ncbi:uncharacterized protein LOC113272834 [Papaver somniferum]|uniref:uncharacterized protein LOC113272834 n=1 Tax=Papaver somniferum TaxID=3469 RepID=UPI000E7012B2|nr:uncharacterized protein LOC113272834 [Papaver somniferum]
MTKCLTPSGRLALTKSSLTPASNHIMQAQLLPINVNKKIDRIIRNSFWVHDSSVKKLHPLGYDKLTRTQSEGGLGIRKRSDHNKALLMKWVWNIQEKPNSIYAILFSEKYLRQQPLFLGTPATPSSTSPQWKQLASLIPTIKQHPFHKIGDGLTTFIQENWIPQFDNTLNPANCYRIQTVSH